MPKIPIAFETFLLLDRCGWKAFMEEDGPAKPMTWMDPVLKEHVYTIGAITRCRKRIDTKNERWPEPMKEETATTGEGEPPAEPLSDQTHVTVHYNAAAYKQIVEVDQVFNTLKEGLRAVMQRYLPRSEQPQLVADFPNLFEQILIRAGYSEQSAEKDGANT